ncbi:hypothetical protein EYF80_039051 [Liparis tanakae]|uniref:Uncharacterized protein n=1 Tax=Liparis tanakae TaxID=230148 RepID=A0A4Z2GBV2_9TELE|nr:hypothetical protein EYF80_039051 [Liparis tanakae]
MHGPFARGSEGGSASSSTEPHTSARGITAFHLQSAGSTQASLRPEGLAGLQLQTPAPCNLSNKGPVDPPPPPSKVWKWITDDGHLLRQTGEADAGHSQPAGGSSDRSRAGRKGI